MIKIVVGSLTFLFDELYVLILWRLAFYIIIIRTFFYSHFSLKSKSTKLKTIFKFISENSSLLPRVNSHAEVPILFREPHIVNGFRELHLPWHSYFLSVFQLHNESMNVWTHLLAAILMIRKMWLFSYEVDFVSDPYTWPMLSGMFCATALYFCSSGAHCLQSKSELVHYVAFMVDYAGIGLYGLGSVILHLAYSSEQSFYSFTDGYFVFVGCLLGFLICLMCTLAKIIYTRPYPFARKLWQMIPVAGIYFWLASPIAHRFYTCWMYDSLCNEALIYHKIQVAWFTASAFFFASDIPQRFFPAGWFDHFLHSHQLFHICIMICTLTQMDAVMLDWKDRVSFLKQNRPEPTLWSAFGPVAITILCEFLCILYCRILARNKIQKDAKKH